jgi:peptidyl-tRNA hydrolase
MIAQAAHTATRAVENTQTNTLKLWRSAGEPKIAVEVTSEMELRGIIDGVRENEPDIPTATVVDQGRTELPEKTLTAGAIGPAKNTRIDTYTGDLPLL